MPNDMNLAFGDARRGLPDCRPAPVCDPRPVCPACGSLECLCRPRFFAGQLLTEEDLNRLDHYIVAKNRLHNRHLFGTGVVCGLEVVCSTCDPAGGGNVVVKPGYALSPCGNDIVVCKQEPVNICELINKCRPPNDDCMQPGGDAQPAGGDETWVLAICYHERQSRGITALRGASCGCGNAGCSGGGGCSCGGGSSCSCGGGSNFGTGSFSYGSDASCGCGGGAATKTAKTRSAAKPGRVAPQCEPTLVCESYSFAVYKVPPKDDSKQPDVGALIKRFICCVQPLLQQLSTIPPTNATVQQRETWLRDLLAAMREFLISEGLYDCEVGARLGQVVVPPRADNFAVYIQQWIAATLQVFAIIAAVLQKCLCSALLPPCPPAEMNDCVPIATVTVSRGRCRVRHICNISNRKFVLTFPAIKYWLSWLPLLTSWASGKRNPTLRELVEKLCCTPIADLFDFDDVNAVNMDRDYQEREPFELRAGVAGAAGAGLAALAAGGAAHVPSYDDIHPFTRLLGESLLGAAEPANAATILLAAMGVRYPDGTPMVSDGALQNPGEAMLIHNVIAPALAPLLPLVGAGRIASSDDARVAELSNKVAALRETVDAQQVAIDRLINR